MKNGPAYDYMIPAGIKTFRVRLSKDGVTNFGRQRRGTAWTPCDARLSDFVRVVWDGTVSPCTINRRFIEVTKR